MLPLFLHALSAAVKRYCQKLYNQLFMNLEKENYKWILMAKELSNEASPTELVELTELLNADPAADIEFSALEQFWNMPAQNDGVYNTSAMRFEKLWNKIKN